MPKLSIIMPTYNGKRFLAEQIDSILAQDDEDFELLITDDGSTDGTRALTDEYAARDRRIRVVPSTGNLGQNNRLAQLLGESRGEYVAISDQDDRWAPDRNSRLFAAMHGRPMAFGRSELIDGEGTAKGKSLLEALGAQFGAGVRLRALFEPMFSAHATIVEREYLTAGSLASPMPFDWLMALESLFSRGLVYVDEAVVFHRIHGGNQVNNIEIARGKFFSEHLRWLVLFRRPARQRLWLVLEYLGRSPLLDTATRRMFATLGQRAYVVWFSEWRSLRNDGGLKADLMEALEPFAGSSQDRDWFAAQVDMLTRPAASRAMLAEVRARMRMR